ncbi:DUF3221 domain-containing protein [Metabacillus litoralis]|uniref:DUF3221 domain-containing protein n=1 Tax=Metabacillus litoralis TaxID=152268 RepID=UPI00203E304A|nr:DUF3221 domain-containing protein [Metabacillus litoralis]MCM3409856.1 YobA family protein [Metabacillus litoralis]
MKNKPLFSVILLLTLLVGCSNTEKSDTIMKSDDFEIEGRIVQLEKESMTVINDLSKEMIKKYSASELLSKRNGKAVKFYFKDTSKKFEVGQLVRVWRDKDSPILDSDPLQMSASKVEVMEE